MFAQLSKGCVAPEINHASNNNQQPPSWYSYSTDPAVLETYDAVLFKVHYWILLEDNDPSSMDDYNYSGTTKNELLNSIAHLNNTYNAYKIFFKYDGYTIVNNSYIALQVNTGNASCSSTPNNYTSVSSANSYI